MSLNFVNGLIMLLLRFVPIGMVDVLLPIGIIDVNGFYLLF